MFLIRANDATGYTLVETRHGWVPLPQRHYTLVADWPAPRITRFWLHLPRVYPTASFFFPNCTLLLSTCTLIRREIAPLCGTSNDGHESTAPRVFGVTQTWDNRSRRITRRNKPQSQQDMILAEQTIGRARLCMPATSGGRTHHRNAPASPQNLTVPRSHSFSL